MLSSTQFILHWVLFRAFSKQSMILNNPVGLMYNYKLRTSCFLENNCKRKFPAITLLSTNSFASENSM